jgi:AcrR family transcriptional regulator
MTDSGPGDSGAGSGARADASITEMSEIGKRRQQRRNSSRRRSDERWKQIQQAASIVFRRLGYAQTTLEAVATEANLNRATLYYYVETKADLLTALLEGVLRSYGDEIEAICQLRIDPDEKLRMIILRHVESLEEHPEHFIYLQENVHKIFSTGSDFILQHAHDYGERVRRVLLEGIEKGTFRDDLDPTIVMLSLSGMLNWVHRWYTPEGPSTLQQVGHTVAELTIGGLRPTRQSP